MDHTLEINQDYDIDFDGEVGSPLDVFWCEGHVDDDTSFIRAVVDHCIEWGRTIPRISEDKAPTLVWQHDRKDGDSVTYIRRDSDEGLRRADWRPVTLLDCERRFMGATSCSVTRCTGPVRSSQGLEVVWEPDGDHLALDMRLCDKHREQMPDQSYRLRFIPVGATILLGEDDN